MQIHSCRICDHKPLVRILDLGQMPPVNFFPAEHLNPAHEQKHPLVLCFCPECGLAQLDTVVSPKILFEEYHYLTSASEPLVLHFRALAEELLHRHFIAKDSKVLDIGANDGTLLLEFKKLGAFTLGVDPAKNAVDAAHKIGIDVIRDFWSPDVAKKIRLKHGKFDVITSNNVFAHTHDVKTFLKGIKELLAPKGIFTVEFAHLLEMVVKNQFDCIYHEHVSYYSLPPLMKLFSMFDLEVFDVKRILTQGGSLRVYVRHKRKTAPTLTPEWKTILQEENDNHITEVATLKSFAHDVRQFRTDFRKLVRSIRKKHHTLVGFGAPAKGVILLNFCGVGRSEIDYIVDSTPIKQGRLLPGNYVPVFGERMLENSKVDYVLILAWNFQEAILKKLEPLRAKGTKVIIPFPKLRVI